MREITDQTRAIVVRRGAPREGSYARRRDEQVCASYAASIGIHGEEVGYLSRDTGEAAFHEPDGESSWLIAVLRGGMHLIAPSLQTLGDHPSQVFAGVRTLIAKGVGVHIPGIGDLLPHLRAIEEALVWALALEQDMRKMQKAHAAEIAQIESDAAEGLKVAVAEMIRRYGVPEGGVPTLSELRAMQNRPIEERQRGVLAAAEQEAEAQREREREAKLIEQEADERVGAYLRTLRDRRGWTLEGMGEMLGISAATLSRLEKHGKGAALASALALLDPGANANDRAALRRRAKAALVAPDAEPEPEPTEAVFAMAAPEASPEPAA